MEHPKFVITPEIRARLRLALLKQVADNKRRKQPRQFIHHDGQIHFVN